MEVLKINKFKPVFLIAGIYDLCMGITFMFFHRRVINILGISSNPEELAPYLNLIGAFLLVMGLAYLVIYQSELTQNRDLILIGSFFKLAYVLVASIFYFRDIIPHPVFFTVFGIIDFIMFLFMIRCYWELTKLKLN